MDWELFYEQFDVWPLARPYAAQMFSEMEARLVLALGKGALTEGQVADRLGLEPSATEALVGHAFHRLIVNREGHGPGYAYRAADFYAFLDYFIKYDGWDDLPPEARQALDTRYRELFTDKVKESLALMQAGQPVPKNLPNDTIMLLPEVEAMVDAATEFAVERCDCRRGGQHCDRPVETCLRLDEGARAALERGHGRTLSRAEAKQLLHYADQKGLMHTADGDWRNRGLYAICNCCACDCYPFGAARVLGSKGVYPRSRYLAEYAASLCTHCGACVRRCHFGAFYTDGATVMVKDKARAAVAFDPQKCWGCGLCANACAAEAITMKPLAPFPP